MKKTQIEEILHWVSDKQIDVHNELMSDTEKTIFSTLQLVKRQIEFIIERDKNKNKNCGSPGHDGC